MIHSGIYPSLPEFKRLARKGNLIPLCMDVMADQLTPVSLLSSQWNSSDYSFLLESVEGGEKLGRYSVVSFDPEALLQEKNGRAVFTTTRGQVLMDYQEPLLDALKRYMRCVKPVAVPGLPRFFGGAVGYCSYEVVHALENLPKTKPDLLGWPTGVFFIANDLFVFDNTQQLLKLVTCVRLNPKTGIERAYRDGCRRLEKRLGMVLNRKPEIIREKRAAVSEEFHSPVDRPLFMKGVKRAKEHISKGDIIQVVLSRRSEKKTAASPLDIYRCLRVVNPSPYMYLVKMKDRAIVGSSPEPLIRLENGVATTRPIAGTRRRGATPDKDVALEKDLLKDPKERAEHIMLVDLGRNDLGRVCEQGTVRVPTFMSIERYSHVMHIVSEVSGRLEENKDAFDLLKAVFPAGTVAGAPKIRAMEIIDDIETCQRGPYAGSIGYFSYSGNMDMAITIRTILWDKGKVSIQTGAGIVADSDPATEYQETENKAAAMKATIRMAETGRLFGDPS